MTYLRYALLAVLLALALMLALANREPVTLALWPETIAAFIGASHMLTLPLFVVVGAAVGLGLVLGLVWEWLRERGIRAEAARNRRELARLREAQGLAPDTGPTQQRERDEVLAILDERPEPR